jgi:predicted metalloprotease with PDZ domain
MKYIVSIPKPHTHFIEIEFVIENNTADLLTLQLPAWRPGRYELQNFARNIQRFSIVDSNNQPLPFKKTTKDCWTVEAKGCPVVHVKYNYYAAQLDAGACWLDENQVYINPVHCFLYIPDRMKEACQVVLHLPDDYKIATSMDVVQPNTLHAKNYDELVDSPFIASNTLQHNFYKVGETTFHIWLQGICKPDWNRILKDFQKFTSEQVNMMESFPTDSYHFLIHVLPYHFYHGVEHLKNTVLAIGPGYNLMEDDLYKELLGLASHELFHSWNIKSIRPIEMMPYDYTKENYSRLGYVCEGVTTYYGDLFLLRSGVFSEKDYFKTFNQQLQKHFDNYGRFNLSVADSSYDTWLDGYVEGIPARKTSIYTEGCLLAFVMDCTIRKHTDNDSSLDDVMLYLYKEYGQKNKGYSETNYQEAVEKVAGTSFLNFFTSYVNGTSDLEPILQEAMNYLGLVLIKTDATRPYENKFGIKILQNETARITSVAPGSVADQAGLFKDDEIMAINGIKLHNNITEWMRFFDDAPLELLINSRGNISKKILKSGEQNYFQKYTIERLEGLTDKQKLSFSKWKNQKLK